MPFVPLRDYLPELEESETRFVTVLDTAENGLPAGVYGFFEMYCDEDGCDCRRVLLLARSIDRKRDEATINFGWESRDFYERWMRDPEPEMITHLKGPCLHFGSRETEYSTALLDLAEKVLLSDEAYVARIKRHYELFRGKIDEGSQPFRSVKVGRNDPCPCGSGRKHKRCCLGK